MMYHAILLFLGLLQVMDETARNIMNQIPVPISIGPVVEKYPVMYEQSINTVLLQEIIRYK